MNKFLKSALAAVLIAILAVSSFAAGSLVTISVDPSIQILVNGNVFHPKDANGNDVMTFTYNGTTYAPLRAMAEAFGLEVGYDADRRMATVGTQRNSNLESYELYLQDTIKTHYDSGFSYTPSYAISDADYQLYNEIMDYLYSDWSKSEDELFAELSLIYGTSAENLRNFVLENMSAAVNRQVGNTSSGTGVSDSDIIECAKSVMRGTLKNYLYFSESDADWTVSAVGLRYVINTAFGLRPGDFSETAVIKIEFSEDYRTFDLYQLKYNNKNIDLGPVIASSDTASAPADSGFTYTQDTAFDVSEDTVPLGKQNALKEAISYLNYSSFSRERLIDQLEYEGYTYEQAVYGVDHCGADWYEQAVKEAISYLDFSAFSYEGLIDQLEYEKFTPEQAAYGVDHCGADWYEQAVKEAISYLDFSAFSYEGLIDQLEYEGYTHDQAVYGVNNCGANW